jgi:glycosyltransferase involved in cell wall biosynthesis
MGKLSLAISCPIDTYSGYGARARDLVKTILATEKYNVQILSQRWGNTRFGYLADHGEDEIASLIVPHLTAKPDVWVQHTVPNEFQKVGTYNIGVTAGIETTLAPPSWLEGVNKMDLVLVSSKHAKTVFEQTKVDIVDNKTGQKQGSLELKTRIEVLFEGVDTTKYFSKVKSDLDLSDIKEQFCYLFVGTWLNGDYGHDRKNIGYTIKSFLESFKNKQTPPALIIKTSHANASIMDREVILKKIDKLRKTVKGKLPNIYLIHGDMTDEEVNDLYNHPKVKVMVNLTKGEGYGRPLLEFTQAKKPIIASGWSGHVDFLDKEQAVLIGGILENVHPSAANDMLLKEAQWFKPDDVQVGKAFRETFKHYKNYLENAKKLGSFNKKEFSLEAMTSKLDSILDENLPDFPEQIELVLPKLELPKLERLDG